MSSLAAPLLDGEREPHDSSLSDSNAAQSNVTIGEGSSGTEGQHPGSCADIVRPFTILGWTAFGGPTAHVALYHSFFVEHRQWLSDPLFAEVLALCQMLPGPSSAQFSFTAGILHAGPLGGLLSGTLFLFPGLLLLTLAGLGASQVLASPPKWVLSASAGLVAVAVALVSQAALMLGYKLCKTQDLQLICCACATIAFSFPQEWIFPFLIIGGGMAVVLRSSLGGQGGAVPAAPSNPDLSAADDASPHLGLTATTGICLIVFWALVLAAAVVAKSLVDYAVAPWVHWFEAFFLTGSVAYGGGQVMLPFLQNVVVQYDTVCPPDHSAPCHRVQSNSTWVTEQEFLTGLGIVQAMPGPFFNFSAYLGACMGGLPGAVVCWLGLFTPGIIALYAALPFWSKFRRWTLYKKALPGFNAAAVGLIFATVFQLGLQTYLSSPFPLSSVSIGMIGFGLFAFLKVPAPVCVLLGACFGLALWGISLLP